MTVFAFLLVSERARTSLKASKINKVVLNEAAAASPRSSSPKHFIRG